MLWLASDEASFVTGEIMEIDGGLSLTTNMFHEWEKENATQQVGKSIKKTIYS